MILARGPMTAFRTAALAAFLAAGAVSLAAGRAGADHIGHSLPALEPAGLIFAATSVDDMPPEMRQAYIRGIQEELAAHHYDPGASDGLLGPKTRAAIRKYQRDAGLAVDGIASKELLDHLKFAQPRVTAKPDPEPDPLVLEVQSRLLALGYHRGELDGRMGAATREAIRAYRYDTGLPISGAIDGPDQRRHRRAFVGEPAPRSGRRDRRGRGARARRPRRPRRARERRDGRRRRRGLARTRAGLERTHGDPAAGRLERAAAPFRRRFF
jgi:peptidoglycan hydrolase-like protein with peptidoglycan-binding domain